MSKQDIAKAMLETALAAREAYAQDFFAWDDVQAKIKAAALEGATHVRLAQKVPHDLQVTDAGLALEARLKDCGFQLHWFPVAVPERIKGQPTGRHLGYRELVIDWSGAHGDGGVMNFLNKDLDGIVQVPEQ